MWFARRIAIAVCAAVLAACLAVAGCGGSGVSSSGSALFADAGSGLSAAARGQAVLASVPPYGGDPSVEVNGGSPFFDDADRAFEGQEFSALDGLGRCGCAFALVGPETLPTEPRGSIGMVKPSGWQISRYEWVDGEYLFNRCHLIGYQLTGENDNELNLITGTRSMNVLGMLPYEERVAAYVERTGNHILYRVTPVFAGDDLVASGVLMEAESKEDDGAGVRFCVWCYNAEPGVAIDYATGANRASDPAAGEAAEKDGAIVDGQSSSAPRADSASPRPGAGKAWRTGDANEANQGEGEVRQYVLNTNTHRFHYPDCPSVDDMKEKNKQPFEGTRDEVIALGYEPCGACRP